MRYAGHILAVILPVLCLTGCRTKYVAVPEYHVRDSVRTEYVRDSLFFRDSVYVSLESRGDTVIKEVSRWRYAYKDRLVRDTVTVVRRDSVPYIVEKKTVEYGYRTRWYDRACRWVAAAALVCAAAVFLSWYVRKRKG